MFSRVSDWKDDVEALLMLAVPIATGTTAAASPPPPSVSGLARGPAATLLLLLVCLSMVQGVSAPLSAFLPASRSDLAALGGPTWDRNLPGTLREEYWFHVEGLSSTCGSTSDSLCQPGTNFVGFGGGGPLSARGATTGSGLKGKGSSFGRFQTSSLKRRDGDKAED